MMTTRTYTPKTSALVLVDLLNDFLAEDGKLIGQIGPMLEKLNFKSHIERLLSAARKAGLVVIFAPHGVDDHSFDDVKCLHPRFQWALDNKVLRTGDYGAEFYEPFKPLPGEIVVSRHRMFNSFQGTDLHAQLKKKNIENVILAGLTSQTCIEGTGRHALELGYHVTFLKDAVAEFTEKAHLAALDISYPTFGHEVLTIDEFFSRLVA